MTRKTKPGAASRAHYRIADRRKFPKFEAGMSVALYAARYADRNRRSHNEEINGSIRLTLNDDFFQPLSTWPQLAQDDTVIEEVSE